MINKVIPAAGVILLSQDKANNNFKVLLLKRHPAIKVHGGHWVFPGGKFDAEDYRAVELQPYAIDIKHPPELLQDDYLLVAQQAALRELQEEAGVILDKQALVYHSRWLTPAALKKRFDTCFFIAEITETDVTVDGREIIEYQWRTVSEHLALHKEGKIAMPPATFVTLVHLSRFSDASAAIASLTKRPASYRPKLISTNQGLCSLYEEDDGYENEDYLAEGKRHRLNMIAGGFEYICD